MCIHSKHRTCKLLISIHKITLVQQLIIYTLLVDTKFRQQNYWLYVWNKPMLCHIQPYFFLLISGKGTLAGIANNKTMD